MSLAIFDTEVNVVANMSTTLCWHGPGDELGDADTQRATLEDVVQYIRLCERADEDSQQEKVTNNDFCHHHMNSPVN